jgi:hypothetical protein
MLNPQHYKKRKEKKKVKIKLNPRQGVNVAGVNEIENRQNSIGNQLTKSCFKKKINQGANGSCL